MRPSVSHIVNGLLVSVALLCAQAPTTGLACSVPVPSAAAELPASPMTQESPAAELPASPTTQESPAPKIRYHPPRPAQLDDLGIVRFNDGQDRGLRGTVRTLRGIQRMMAAHEEVRRFRIEGHADDSGDPCFNLEISKRRVRRIAQWLIDNGVAAERLELIACGRRHAGQGYRRQTVRAQNRRVELSVSEPAQGVAQHGRCDPIELE